MKKIGLSLLIVLIACIAHVFISTGYFRKITASTTHPIIAKIPIMGAEDIVISPDESFALISATNRGSYPPQKIERGALYYLDLTDGSYSPIKLTADLGFEFAPHGIDLFPINDSTYQILAINHINKQHSIEKFILNKKKLIHLASMRHPSMIQPNDVVQTAADAFYFTNDHGYTQGLMKTLEEYGGLALSNVVFYDGVAYREVASGIAYANGIAFDRQRQLVYVASPRHFSVKVYRYQIGGDLKFLEDIDCGTGVDNITLDKQGKVWIGAHPNLLRFAAYAQGKYNTSPSEIITLDYKKKGANTVERIWEDPGDKMSGATVAVPFSKGILTGNVMDKHFLILGK